MPLVFADDKRIFFAHVPKAGGTSVEDYLKARFGEVTMLNRNWNNDTRRSGGLRGSAGLIAPPQHLSATDLRQILPAHIDFSFAMVRDPVQRMISEYHFRNMTLRGRRMGFSLWLRLVLQAYRISPTVLENHIRPQSDLVPEDCEIFRLEDGFELLRRRLDDVCGEVAPQIKFPHALAKAKGFKAVPSPADLALIFKAYDLDYIRFGYTLSPAEAEFDGLTARSETMQLCL
jgi:hypothetical protein